MMNQELPTFPLLSDKMTIIYCFTVYSFLINELVGDACTYVLIRAI